MSYNLYTTCYYTGSHKRDGRRGMLVQQLLMHTRGKHLGCRGIGGKRHGHESRTCR